MSSGHTGKGGRGNRRARRGSQRPRGPEGQNGQGQTHSSSAMLILSSGAHQAPAHEPREPKEPRDISRDDADTATEEGARREAELEPADEEMSMPAGTSEASGTSGAPVGRERDPAPSRVEMEDGEAVASQDAVKRAHARDEGHDRHAAHMGNAAHEEHHGPTSTPPAGGARGPHERGQPYAPGMRTQASQMAQTPQILRPRHAPPTDAGAGASARWLEREESRDAPLAPSRTSRAEHDDWGDASERGDHPPLQPEVRGEVGPLIDALHGLFEQDRATASQGGTTRCGICYLHFALADLEYREAEGFYVCHACARSLGNTRLPMVRRQQRA